MSLHAVCGGNTALRQGAVLSGVLVQALTCTVPGWLVGRHFLFPIFLLAVLRIELGALCTPGRALPRPQPQILSCWFLVSAASLA